MIFLSVMYPADAEIDFDYYRGTHIPLLRREWGDKIAEVRLLRGVGAADGGQPANELVALIGFQSMADLETVMARPGTAEIMADVANFTNLQAIVQISEELD